jgi:hypothetical protein
MQGYGLPEGEEVTAVRVGMQILRSGSGHCNHGLTLGRESFPVADKPATRIFVHADPSRSHATQEGDNGVTSFMVGRSRARISEVVPISYIVNLTSPSSTAATPVLALEYAQPSAVGHRGPVCTVPTLPYTPV